MIGARDQRGFTLIEMVVAMALSLIVMSVAMYLLVTVLNDNRADAFRDSAQSDAQVMIDRLSHELRNAASPSSGSAGLLEKAAPYDIVFQTVSAGPVYTGNPTNQIRVRYCLDGNLTLWRQTQTWTTPTAPSVPDTSACPSTSNAWNATYAELNDATNEIGGDTTRPLFTYGPSGWTNTSQINQVQVDLYIDRNPGHLPGATELTSGVYLRNELAPPVSLFTPTYVPSSRTVQLNASASYDPQGQALSYQWYSAAGCPAASAISGATTQQYTAGPFTVNTNQTFSLQVTNTGGLSTCSAAQTVAIQ